MRAKLVRGLAWTIGLALLVLSAWMIAIGPVAVWRVLTHGTTTVWDHEEYSGRRLQPAPDSKPWPVAAEPLSDLELLIGGGLMTLEDALTSSHSLSYLMVQGGEVVFEWYAEGHDLNRPIMTFSVSKSLLSMLVGVAIEEGLIQSVGDPVTQYLPEMTAGGLDRVSIEQLLTMDSSLDYVEGDNPFQEHVMFNYTPHLARATLNLRVRDEKELEFRYKSGDYAVLGLLLDRVLEDQSITDYLQTRIWDRIGASGSGVWSTDHEDGLERAWCCLAMTARDLARFGQLMLDQGQWGDQQVIPREWVGASLNPRFGGWPSEYASSPLVNYGYGWWHTDSGAWVALGKDGQYLYVDPVGEWVIVRQGQGTGDFSWVEAFEVLSQPESR